jgi:hypothetical protein
VARSPQKKGTAARITDVSATHRHRRQLTGNKRPMTFGKRLAAHRRTPGSFFACAGSQFDSAALMTRFFLTALWFVCLALQGADPIQFRATVDFDRWMYPFNGTPGTRPSASVFGTLDPNSGADSRDGQFLLGWTTSNSVPAGRSATGYRLRSARVILTVNRGDAWVYDGTQDRFETYLSTNDSRRLPDADPGRPIELFGAGFRHGFTAATFPEDGPFQAGGEGQVGTRTAYAAGNGSSGVLTDVSNNVGKADTNAFEVTPFAVGMVTNVAPGDRVPLGAAVIFELNLADPHIEGYLRDALNIGILRLMVTSLGSGSFSGAPNFPQFFTRDSPLAAEAEKPRIEIDVELIDPVREAPIRAALRPAGPVVEFPAAGGRPTRLLESTDLITWSERSLEPVSVPSGWEWPVPVESAQRFFRLP